MIKQMIQNHFLLKCFYVLKHVHYSHYVGSSSHCNLYSLCNCSLVSTKNFSHQTLHGKILTWYSPHNCRSLNTLHNPSKRCSSCIWCNCRSCCSFCKSRSLWTMSNWECRAKFDSTSAVVTIATVCAVCTVVVMARRGFRSRLNTAHCGYFK